MLLAGLGVAALAVFFSSDKTEQFALIDYNVLPGLTTWHDPVDPAVVYADNALNPDREWADVKPESPLVRYVLVKGESYARLEKGGWLRSLGPNESSGSFTSIILMSRGGLLYSLDIDPIPLSQLDPKDPASMNAFFTGLGDFDDKLREVQVAYKVNTAALVFEHDDDLYDRLGLGERSRGSSSTSEILSVGQR